MAQTNQDADPDILILKLLLQPLGLSGGPTLHALTVIPKFDEGLRGAELS